MTSFQQLDWRPLKEPCVAVAAVTSDRPKDLCKLAKALSKQTIAAKTIDIVDNGTDTVSGFPSTETTTSNYRKSETNLGGAGGFSLAILSAIATGADWIWIMDDDAYPVGNDCLEKLIAAANERDLDVVSPIIVSPDNHARLSFPYQVDGKICYDRKAVEALNFIPSMAQFFNGALVRREVFFRVGLPDMRLFIRGDEVDFMLRLRKAKVPFGTVTDVAVAHPPGWGEVVPIIEDRIHILVPETDFKKFHFFRNRGYLARRHRRWRSFLGDVLLYSYLYVFKQRGNWKGWRFWADAYLKGLTYRFDTKETVYGKK